MLEGTGQKELNLRYKKITRPMIAIYLNLCDNSEKKRNVPTKELVFYTSLTCSTKNL